MGFFFVGFMSTIRLEKLSPPSPILLVIYEIGINYIIKLEFYFRDDF